MVWDQDAVWCTFDDGLWTIQHDKLRTADIPIGIKVCPGNLSVGDGVMLLAGESGAALHDGAQWQRLIDFNDLG